MDWRKRDRYFNPVSRVSKMGEMKMEPISDEVRRACQRVSRCIILRFATKDEEILNNAYRHERAMRMKLEFFQDAHADDPLIFWTDAQWEAAVDEDLKVK